MKKEKFKQQEFVCDKLNAVITYFEGIDRCIDELCNKLWEDPGIRKTCNDDEDSFRKQLTNDVIEFVGKHVRKEKK